MRTLLAALVTALSAGKVRLMHSKASFGNSPVTLPWKRSYFTSTREYGVEATAHNVRVGLVFACSRVGQRKGSLEHLAYAHLLEILLLIKRTQSQK